MPVPACGNGRARAEEPRARRSPLEGGVYPRPRRSSLEWTFEWAALVGCGGYRSVGRAPCVRLSEMRLALVFLVLSGISRVVSGTLRAVPGNMSMGIWDQISKRIRTATSQQTLLETISISFYYLAFQIKVCIHEILYKISRQGSELLSRSRI
jgi:hypothetical protein